MLLPLLPVTCYLLIVNAYQLPGGAAENFLLVHALGDSGRGGINAGHYGAETELNLLFARVEKIPVETRLVVHHELHRLRPVVTPIVRFIRGALR